MVRVGVSPCDRMPLTAWPAFTKDTPGYYKTLLIRQVCCFEDKKSFLVIMHMSKTVKVSKVMEVRIPIFIIV